ncbi:MAG: helix-turn-helix transcriptional regulator [Ignavibacteriaceae bacterium]|nr:helix-turn-helix transcriptional regulator [Ignavibacteriaceae bacterium]
MVCNRCIKVVKEELEKLRLKVNYIALGEVRVTGEVNKHSIKKSLEENGFELLDDKHAAIIEKIKITLIELIHHQNGDELLNINYSTFLSEKIGMSYQHLSSLFSSLEGITIEKYIINQKIEKVKELLIYDELTLSEIAYRLGYSSVQYLSNQFKKTTGFSPSQFKLVKERKRTPLDKI